MPPTNQHETSNPTAVDHATTQLVWKMFCTMLLLQRAAAASSSATSPLLSLHPSALRFSFACTRSLAPGMGTVPLQTHQLIATWNRKRSQCTNQVCQLYTVGVAGAARAEVASNRYPQSLQQALAVCSVGEQLQYTHTGSFKAAPRSLAG